ncbi:hypothetical protein V502_01491 [Pseudogymnoascus sp. VKM F-4520 (FW-2644)]|nr:hypothetical protein V502_01491 [Pseudogymnoascus sp. VKM F-4520 (FW-2644)]
MKLTVLAAAALACSTAAAFPITGDSVNCRSGPGTSYAVKKSYAKGHSVTITCQTGGTSVNGNSIWDKTSDGCYVADYYVKTGSSGYVKPKCGGGGGGNCSAPKSNAATVDLIAEFEGFVPKVYTDATGHPTVGYGHLCSNSKCSDAGYPIPLSKANGKKLLAKDMGKAEKCVTAMVNSKVTLNANEYGALVSLAFNVGCGAMQSSSLVKRLNNGEKASVVYPVEFPKWVHGNGKVLPGLVRRRKAEVALSKKAAGKALPC